MIPIVIIAFNQLTYIRNMVNQCLRLTDKIYIVDNASTYQPLLDWYKNEVPQIGCVDCVEIERIQNSTNLGSTGWQKHIDKFPDEFVVTDPDILLNPEMPTNATNILSDIARRFSYDVVGIALDISEHQNFVNTTFCGRNIYDHEMQFWKDKIQSTPEEVYRADVDTTFALRCKQRHLNLGGLRVAGRFTCKHIPWYRSEKSPLPISTEERSAYVQTRIKYSWG